MIPSNLALADLQFHEPGLIDHLIEMEMYYDLRLEDCFKLGPERPILQNTVLGWVASEKVGSNQASEGTPKRRISRQTDFSFSGNRILLEQ